MDEVIIYSKRYLVSIVNCEGFKIFQKLLFKRNPFMMRFLIHNIFTDAI